MDWLREAVSVGLPDKASRGLYPGAVAAVALDGVVQPIVALGQAVRYSDRYGRLLPPSRRIPMRPDTLFDLASVTKVYMVVLALKLVEAGRLDLDAPVAPLLPDVPGLAGSAVSLRHLLTHTAGLPAGVPEAKRTTDPAVAWSLIRAVTPQTDPGTVFRYSDVSAIFAGKLVEAVAGRGLDRLLHEWIAGPLGLTATTYRPPEPWWHRAAATEDVGSGCRRGQVHDETAFALGGVAGHAGIFSTAAEVLRFGELLRCGGTIDGVTILRPDLVAEMVRDQLPPEVVAPGCRHGLGVRLHNHALMGPLADTGFGHPGFTGTSLVVDPARAITVVLLSNRVHPSRDWSHVEPVRQLLCEAALNAR